MNKSKISYYYEYLFYKYYSWNIFTTDKTRYELGWMLLSLAEYFNFLTLLLVSQFLTGYGFIQFYQLSKIQITLVWLMFLGFNYIVLIRNKKYLMIVERFENEKERSRILGNIIAFMYFFGSLIMGVTIAYFVSIFHHI